MHWAKRIDRGMQQFNKGLMYIACGFLAVLVASCIMMVLTRFIPNFTLTGLEEIARYSFIYLTFFSLGAGTGTNAHPGLTLLRDAVPKKPRFLLDMVVYLFILLFGVIFIIYGYQATLKVAKLSSTSWRIPMSYIYISSVFGGTFVTLNTLNNLLQLILFHDDKRSEVIEEVQVVERQMKEEKMNKEGVQS